METVNKDFATKLYINIQGLRKLKQVRINIHIFNKQVYKVKKKNIINFSQKGILNKNNDAQLIFAIFITIIVLNKATKNTTFSQQKN